MIGVEITLYPHDYDPLTNKPEIYLGHLNNTEKVVLTIDDKHYCFKLEELENALKAVKFGGF